MEIEVLKLTDSVKSIFTVRGRIRFHVIPELHPELSTYHTVTNVHLFGFKCLLPTEEQSGK